MIKFLTLNIRHGGGFRGAAIATAIRQVDPAVVVITEFRNNSTGIRLCQELGECGWPYIASSRPPTRVNGVVIASKVQFAACPQPAGVPEGSWRWLECAFDGFDLVGTYLPLNQRKVPYWDWLLERARERADRPCLFMGDFNTGKHRLDEEGATFVYPQALDKMEELGYRDAWRMLHPTEREYTWFSQRARGFRLDYAWLAPALIRCLRSATHLHETRCPEITDHAGLLIELDAASSHATVRPLR